MSYDIRFAVKVEGGPEDCFAVIGEPEYNHPTYNLGNMFRSCTGWDFEQSKFYRVSEVLPLVRNGIAELIAHPRKYKKYEPDNGWGSISGALKALQSIVAWLQEGNWDGLAGTWNCEVPIECIWIAW